MRQLVCAQCGARVVYLRLYSRYACLDCDAWLSMPKYGGRLLHDMIMPRVAGEPVLCPSAVYRRSATELRRLSHSADDLEDEDEDEGDYGMDDQGDEGDRPPWPYS